MGLFDWIGEALGNAFSALAEFFGDKFGDLFKSIGGKFLEVGKENLGNVVTDIEDPESKAAADMKRVITKIEQPIKEGFEHHLKEISKRHSEIPIEEIDKEVTTLWNDVKAELATATGIATVIEAVTFGQVEGGQNIMNVADKTRGLSSFANEVSMIRLRAIYLNMYTRYQNQANPTVLPGPGDLVRFGLREVFDPTRKETLMDPQAPPLYYKYMAELGFNNYHASNYWAEHWKLPAIGQLNEMLHRRVITPKQHEDYLRYNDYIKESWPWLTAISYNPYTRVDTRRMWDLGLLSDTEVLNNYMDLGYDEEHATRMTIWTKAYVLSVELRARYSKGWITADQVLDEIVAAGVPKARAEIWVQKIVKPEKEGRTETERDLTKAEIVKGVKEGILEPSDAIQMLMGLGYDDSEAEYILTVNLAHITGSPENKEEFWELVNLRRKAQGLPVIKVPAKPKKASKGNGENKRTLSPKK